MNVIVRLEIELADNDFAIQRFNHSTIESLIQQNVCVYMCVIPMTIISILTFSSTQSWISVNFI